jgi:hypothetical protein
MTAAQRTAVCGVLQAAAGGEWPAAFAKRITALGDHGAGRSP